ncbi:MAG: DotU family type IV/VI secretion system protein [Planctomycetes bacterium]|nr:DotU family type IV/VI secretion system protein [Planctomycetota bacterium]
MAGNQMTLADLCEPLFQYVCRLNRSSRKHAVVAENQVRSDLRGLVTEMRSKAGAAPGLLPQFEKVELVLFFFADSMIKQSELPFAATWENLAYERNELAGDEKFFELLDDTLSDPSESASERLEIFYLCLGLGFTGWFDGQPEYLRRKMMDIAPRIRGKMVADEMSRICSDAYENVNTANLIEPPGTNLVGLGIALIAMLAVVFVAIIVVYVSATSEYSAAVNALAKQDQNADAAPAVEESAP